MFARFLRAVPFANLANSAAFFSIRLIRSVHERSRPCRTRGALADALELTFHRSPDRRHRLSELYQQKVQVVERWLHDDEKLAGGAGKKIMAMRAHAFPDRESLLRETADKVSIRSTGHSWCLSQYAEGCGGKGLYERTRCGPCGESVIDKEFEPIWREIYFHQMELRQDAHAMGPGAKQRVERDLSRAREVLVQLGVSDLGFNR